MAFLNFQFDLTQSFPLYGASQNNVASSSSSLCQPNKNGDPNRLPSPVRRYFSLGTTAPLLVSSLSPWFARLLGYRRRPHAPLVFVGIVIVFGRVNIAKRCRLRPFDNHTNNGQFSEIKWCVVGGSAVDDPLPVARIEGVGLQLIELIW